MKRRFFTQRPVRIRVEPTGHGTWRATATGVFGRVVSSSPAGRLDQAQDYAANYERYRAWQKS